MKGPLQGEPPRIIQDSAYSAVWAEALAPAQRRSPLGRHPYDLRHAAVSLWLNSGVPATEVADAANQRIADALGTQYIRPESEPGDEGDDDSEQAS